MEPIPSQIDPHDAEHHANREAMDAIMADYRKAMAWAMAGGGADAVA